MSLYIHPDDRVSCKHKLRDVMSCALAPRQTLAATGLQNGVITLWETTSGQNLMELEGAHKGPVTGVTFNLDGSLLASCGEDCNLVLWDLSRIDNKQIKHRFLPGHGPNTPLLHCQFSPDSMLLASCGKDGDVMLWGQLGRPVAGRLVGHTNWVTCCAWAPTNKYLVTGSFDHSVILWEMQTFHSVRTIRHHQAPVSSVSMSIEGTVIASGDHEGVVFVTHIDGTVLRELRGHREAVTGVAFAEIHGLVLSCGHDFSVKFWSLRGHCVRSVGVHRGRALSMAVNETQDLVITTGDDFCATIMPFEWREEGAGKGGADDSDDDEEQSPGIRALERGSQSDRGTHISDKQSDRGTHVSDKRSAVDVKNADKRSSASGAPKDSRSSAA